MKIPNRPSLTQRIAKHSPKIFEQSPIERNQLGFIPRFLCQASLPKTLINTSEWTREFYNHKYTIRSPSRLGVPCGIYSRFILIHLTTLARSKKSATLSIGKDYATFMNSMGFSPSGGKNGSIQAFKEHFIRCINSTVHEEHLKANNIEHSDFSIIDSPSILQVDDWDWSMQIQLSDSFFEETQKSIPTDLGALLCLRPGTLRIDIFNFLVKRFYYLKKETLIPWDQLAAMFSSPDISNKRFRQSFKEALAQACVFYPTANLKITPRGLLLSKSQMLIQPFR